VLRGKADGKCYFFIGAALAKAEPQHFPVPGIVDVFFDSGQHIRVFVDQHNRTSKIKNAATIPLQEEWRLLFWRLYSVVSWPFSLPFSPAP
jgi:hypothetical protein